MQYGTQDHTVELNLPFTNVSGARVNGSAMQYETQDLSVELKLLFTNVSGAKVIP